MPCLSNAATNTAVTLKINSNAMEEYNVIIAVFEYANIDKDPLNKLSIFNVNTNKIIN